LGQAAGKGPLPDILSTSPHYTPATLSQVDVDSQSLKEDDIVCIPAQCQRSSPTTECDPQAEVQLSDSTVVFDEVVDAPDEKAKNRQKRQ